jgi:hypothetical protein
MAKSTVGMIEQISHEIEAIAGPTVREQVMEGAANLSTKSNPTQTSQWVKGAIDRLDSLASEEARIKIMENCGTNCAHLNTNVMDRGKARRMKYPSEEGFLAAEQRKPQAGTRLERQGNTLFQIYTPQAFTHPMRCFCGLMRGLPAGEQVSPTYCHCSKAFVKTYWEAVLGRTVTVEILESAITGSAECRFKITL